MEMKLLLGEELRLGRARLLHTNTAALQSSRGTTVLCHRDCGGTEAHWGAKGFFSSFGKSVLESLALSQLQLMGS